jgi:hypothetical protein
MLDNKLFELFNSLSGVEKREFAKYLRSPYFNQREDVIALYDRMSLRMRGKGERAGGEPGSGDPRNGISEGDAAGLAEREPGGSRHLQSILLQLIENFLAQRAWEQTPVLADLHLAPIYRRKGLKKALDHIFRRTEERLARQPRDNTYYRQLYELEWEKYAAVESAARTRSNNLAAVHRALDVYLVGSKLRLACLMASHSAVFNQTYDTSFLPALLGYLEFSDLKEVPVVALYYRCYHALTGGAEDDFRALRAGLERTGAELPVDERRTFLLLAINYCIRRLNSGEGRYVREALDLYRVGLDTGVLLENERLGRFAYKNIVALGIKLEEFDWVEQFIKAYEDRLDARYRSAHRDYNLAKLYFARQDYTRAMPLLARVDESDLLLNLDSRVMLLKMYFEQGAWDSLDALLDSFRVLLLRKKRVIGYHQGHYLNTVRYVQKLIRLKPGDRAGRDKLKSELLGNTELIEREWLLQRLNY